MNNLTTIFIDPPTFFKLNFLSLNVIVFFHLIEVIMYFVYSDNWKIPEKFSEISRDFVFDSVPQKIRKIGDQVLRISKEFPEKYSGNMPRKNSREILMNFQTNNLENFSGISWEKFRRKSQEFLESNFQNSDSLKIS